MTQTPTPIPRAPGLPVLGNIPDIFAGPTYIDAFAALARKHGPIVEIGLPGGRPVLVSSQAFAREIWDDRRFRKTVGGPVELLRGMLGDGLFTAFEGEPNWQKAHDLLLPAFAFGSMKRYFPHMREVAMHCVEAWAASPGAWRDVGGDMTRLTLDTIALCGFGARFDSFSRPTAHPFVDAMIRALLEYQKKSTLPPPVDRLRIGARRRLAADLKRMNDTVDGIIRQRRRSGERAPDLLDRMLYARDTKSGAGLDDVNIRHQVLTFLIAGHETTSGMLSFALYLLLTHPDAMARARAEVDRVLGAGRDAMPTWDHIGALDGIKQVLQESLRLYPTAPLVARQARARTVVGGRYVVEPAQDLLMLLPLLHRDPAVWGPDADRFDPAHFDKAAMAARPPHAFKGFGSGRRACIGARFALVEGALVLALLLHRFELTLEPGYDFGLVQTLTVKPRALRVRATPR